MKPGRERCYRGKVTHSHPGSGMAAGHYFSCKISAVPVNFIIGITWRRHQYVSTFFIFSSQFFLLHHQ